MLLWLGKTNIRSYDDIMDVTTTGLSWHVQNCDMMGLLESKLEQKEFSKDVNHELMETLWNES